MEPGPTSLELKFQSSGTSAVREICLEESVFRDPPHNGPLRCYRQSNGFCWSKRMRLFCLFVLESKLRHLEDGSLLKWEGGRGTRAYTLSEWLADADYRSPPKNKSPFAMFGRSGKKSRLSELLYHSNPCLRSDRRGVVTLHFQRTKLCPSNIHVREEGRLLKDLSGLQSLCQDFRDQIERELGQAKSRCQEFPKGDVGKYLANLFIPETLDLRQVQQLLDDVCARLGLPPGSIRVSEDDLRRGSTWVHLELEEETLLELLLLKQEELKELGIADITPQLPAEVVKKDQRHKWSQGNRVPLQSYLQSHPELTRSPELVVDLVKAEIALRQDFGEETKIQEYADAYDWVPGFGEAFRNETVGFGNRETANDLMSDSADKVVEVHAMSEDYPVWKKGDEPVPGYILQEDAPLGEGGSGEVWLAQSSGNIPCVLKRIFLSKSSEDPSLGEKERKALDIVKNNKCIYLIGVQAFWETDGELVIAMERAEESLSDYKKKQPDKRIPLATLLEFIQNAAKGLDWLHKHNIVHRDVKPANLLRFGDQVKVGDLGLLKQLDSSQEERTFGGHHGYVAPEQVLGEPCFASDQYSLAVTYWELRTGKQPKRTGNFDPSGLPKEEKEIVAKAMSQDPENRYPSCEAFVDALSQAEEPSSTQCLSAQPEDDLSSHQKVILEKIESLLRPLGEGVIRRIEQELIDVWGMDHEGEPYPDRGEKSFLEELVTPERVEDKLAALVNVLHELEELAQQQALAKVFDYLLPLNYRPDLLATMRKELADGGLYLVQRATTNITLADALAAGLEQRPVKYDVNFVGSAALDYGNTLEAWTGDTTSDDESVRSVAWDILAGLLKAAEGLWKQFILTKKKPSYERYHHDGGLLDRELTELGDRFQGYLNAKRKHNKRNPYCVLTLPSDEAARIHLGSALKLVSEKLGGKLYFLELYSPPASQPGEGSGEPSAIVLDSELQETVHLRLQLVPRNTTA